jgi:hypothetical protein
VPKIVFFNLLRASPAVLHLDSRLACRHAETRTNANWRASTGDGPPRNAMLSSRRRETRPSGTTPLKGPDRSAKPAGPSASSRPTRHRHPRAKKLRHTTAHHCSGISFEANWGAGAAPAQSPAKGLARTSSPMAAGLPAGIDGHFGAELLFPARLANGSFWTFESARLRTA